MRARNARRWFPEEPAQTFHYEPKPDVPMACIKDRIKGFERPSVFKAQAGSSGVRSEPPLEIPLGSVSLLSPSEYTAAHLHKTTNAEYWNYTFPQNLYITIPSYVSL